MKKILPILFITAFCFSAKSQFPGTDSLRNFNNRFTTNNALQAFTNLRMHNLLAGMIDWIDSARFGAGGTIGIDTLYAVNDSTLRYRKNGVFRTFIVRGTAWAGKIYEVPFSNGFGRFYHDSNFVFINSTPNASQLTVGPITVIDGGLSKANITSDNMNALALTAYGTGLNTIIARRAGGSVAVPTGITNGSDLWNFSGRGYSGTQWSGTRAGFYSRANQNWTDSTQGTFISFQTTHNDSLIPYDRFILDHDGHVVLKAYPYLISVIDTSTYKPLVYNKNTGYIEPFINWHGSGINIGGSTGQVQTNIAGNFHGDAGFTYDTLKHKVTTDSTSAIQHRANYVTLNVIRTIDTARGFGNSITVGSGATVPDSAYINILGAYLGKPVGNYAISGRGAVTAIAQHFRYTPLLSNDMTIVDVDFNDLRRNNIFGASGYKTINKSLNAHKSIFVNHFMKSFVQAGCTSCSVTRYTHWAAPWDATAEAGKSSAATYTSTTNDSITYTFTDSTVCIGFIGQTSAYQAGSAFSVYVDGVLAKTGTTDNQSDGIDDGFGNGNNRCPMAVIITGLTYAAHTVKVVNNGSGVFIVDYFAHLRDAATAPPLVILNATYMDATGYATSPNASSVARTDTMNHKLDSLVLSFPAAYRARTYDIKVNNCYDTLTGLSATDHIHPNNTGHRQIFNCIAASLATDNKPLGSLYYANNALYFTDTIGPKKIILGAGSANAIPKFTAPNQIGTSQIQDDGTYIGIAQTPATYKFSITGTLRSTADAYFASTSGNVGVGTTSPNYKLDVSGTAGCNGAITSYGTASGFNLTNRNTGASEWSLFANASSLNFYSIPNTIVRANFWARGGLTLSRVAESNITDNGVTLDVHGGVRIDKDSIQIVNSIGSNYILVEDTTSGVDSNKLKRIALSNLGVITSINSQTGPAYTISTGTGLTSSLGSNSITVSVDNNSTDITHVVDKQFTDANNSGTSETDLYSKSIAANTLINNGASIHFDVAGQLNDATATADIQFYFAGTSFGNTGVLTLSATGAWSARGYVIRATSTTARAFVTFTTQSASAASYTFETDLTGLDFTTGNILKVTGQAGGATGGSNDITAKTWKLIFQP